MDKGALLISCGVPGSGKTTKLKSFPWNGIIVSRDDIRFNLIKNNTEDYFSKEDEVWEIFTSIIKDNLENGINVIADATHLTPGSRRKLINAVGKSASVIMAMNFYCPLKVCLERNELRKGTAAYVPQEQIRKMYSKYEPAFKEEGFFDVLDVNL